MKEPETFVREELGKRFTLKKKSIGSSEQFLGNKVSLVTLENGVKCWSFSSSQYVQAAVKNVEDYRTRANLGPLLKAKSPWPSNYRPEADVTPELASTKVSYCEYLIGALLWIVELEKGKMLMEVSEIASMIARPREVYLSVVLKTLSFLKCKHNEATVIDPADPDIEKN